VERCVTICHYTLISLVVNPAADVVAAKTVTLVIINIYIIINIHDCRSRPDMLGYHVCGWCELRSTGKNVRHFGSQMGSARSDPGGPIRQASHERVPATRISY
jgi:hypothetical protein